MKDSPVILTNPWPTNISVVGELGSNSKQGFGSVTLYLADPDLYENTIKYIKMYIFLSRVSELERYVVNIVQ
jgi:hypothetical protein